MSKHLIVMEGKAFPPGNPATPYVVSFNALLIQRNKLRDEADIYRRYLGELEDDLQLLELELNKLVAERFKEPAEQKTRIAWASFFYWNYWELKRETIACFLGVSKKEITRLVEPANVYLICTKCREKFALAASNRSEHDQIVSRAKTTALVCEKCSVLSKEEQRERRIRELASMPYAKYLQTPEWADRRARKITEAGSRCQLCNSEKRLEVHHRTYERRGAELDSDLTVLCRKCHEKFHDIHSVTEANA